MNWRKYLPIIGIVLFIFILVKINILEVVNEIRNANIFFIAASLIVVLGMFFIQTLKWFVIAREQRIKIPFKEAFKINVITNFYGFITPSKLGTVIRAEYLKKYTGNIGKGLCNFTLDKIFDLSSVFFMAILFSFMFREKIPFLPIKFFIFIFAGLVLATVIFISKSRSKAILRVFLKRMFPEKMKKKAKMAFDSFYDNIPRKRYFAVFFMLNVVNWVTNYFAVFLIGKSLGINLSFIYFLAILPIGTLISLIPISVNGLGTREAGLISLFSLFGVSASKVFSMSLLSIFIVMVVPSAIGSFLMFKNQGKIDGKSQKNFDSYSCPQRRGKN